MKVFGRLGLIATALAVLLVLSGTAHAYLYTGYNGYRNTGYGYDRLGYTGTYNAHAYQYNTYHRRYAVQPRMPYFNADENRPEGYGLARSGTPYPIPTRSCANHNFLGHRSGFDGRTAFYDAVNARQRTHPRYRAQSNRCPPLYRLNPNVHTGYP